MPGGCKPEGEQALRTAERTGQAYCNTSRNGGQDHAERP
jgi:hypothetical protein